MQASPLALDHDHMRKAGEVTLGRAGRRAVLVVALLVWAAAFLYLTLTPHPPRFGSVDVEDYGSWGHVLGSMGVAAILYLVARDWLSWSRWGSAIAVVVAVGAFGVVIELIQALIGDRDASVSDALFDLLGAAIAVAVLTVASRRVGALSTWVVAVTVVFAVATAVAAVFFTPGPERHLTFGCTVTKLTHHRPRSSPPSVEGRRTTEGVVALYVPGPSDRRVVRNQRAGDASSNLHLVTPGVTATDDGLAFSGGLARTTGSAREITDEVMDAKAMTIEVWARSSDLDQDGPTRLVTISDGVELDDVNVHLGQEDDALSVRLRTSCADVSWTLIPGVFDSDARWEHVAFTFAGDEGRVYVQGRLVDAWRFDGQLTGWDRSFPLVLGNETTRDRPFHGDIALTAVYDRALTPREVAASAAAGVPEA